MNATAAVPGNKLRPEDLFSLEQYAKQRPEFRPKVIAHKRSRTLQCGPNATWCFEDRLTVQYQVQEMLRIERILLIEFPEVEQRRVALARMKGIEDRCWVQVAGHERVFAIADEDLERENDEKTSSVHFLRFELTPAMVAAAKGGAAVSIGMDHDAYRQAIDPLPQAARDALVRDLS